MKARIVEAGDVRIEAAGVLVSGWHFDCDGGQASISSDGVCGWSVAELVSLSAA